MIGIVLSGELDDGTAGLLTIKQCGGIAIVQDPATAVAPSMPASAAEYVNVDYSISASEIGALVNDLVRETVPEDFQCPEAQKKELDLLAGTTRAVQWKARADLFPSGALHVAVRFGRWMESCLAIDAISVMHLPVKVLPRV